MVFLIRTVNRDLVLENLGRNLERSIIWIIGI
jgi:hypothetical protein